jgi:protein-disulfide isomerase
MSESVDKSINLEKISINKTLFYAIIIGAVIAIAAATFAAGFILGGSSPEANSNDLVKSDLDDKIAELEAQIEPTQAPTPTPSQVQVMPTFTNVDTISFDGNPLKGDSDAPVTIVEFSDFQCPFCARWFHQTLSQIEDDYIDTGKANLVFVDNPLSSIHPNAMKVHIAAECADEQGKFWEFHDILFERQAEWKSLNDNDLTTKIGEYAASLEINTETFWACTSTEEISDEINADGIRGRSYGVTGTPTFFVGNEETGYYKLVGAKPYSDFVSAIDAKLSQ